MHIDIHYKLIDIDIHTPIHIDIHYKLIDMDIHTHLCI